MVKKRRYCYLEFCWVSIPLYSTTPNIVGATVLGVVACMLVVVCKRMQQLPGSLGPAVHRGKNTTPKAPCKWTQHCWPTTWMLHVASVCTPCCMLLDVVACRCAKFETGQTFQPTTPTISFVPWSPKRSARMLDPFAQFFQHCWGHARSLRVVYKDLWVVSFPRCTAGPNIVGSCCIRLHTTANTHATTPNIVGATLLGVVASVCTQPNYQYFKLGTTRSCVYSKLQQYFKILMLHIELLVIWYVVYFLGQLECWRTFCKYGSSPCLNFN